MKRIPAAVIMIFGLMSNDASAVDCSHAVTAKLCRALGETKTICRVISVGKTCDAPGNPSGEFLNSVISYPDRGGLIHDVHETLSCSVLSNKSSCSGMRQVSEAGSRSLPTFFRKGEVPDWFYTKNMPKKGERIACVHEQAASKTSNVFVDERAVLGMNHSGTAVLDPETEYPSADAIVRALRKAGKLPACLYEM